MLTCIREKNFLEKLTMFSLIFRNYINKWSRITTYWHVLRYHTILISWIYLGIDIVFAWIKTRWNAIILFLITKRTINKLIVLRISQNKSCSVESFFHPLFVLTSDSWLMQLDGIIVIFLHCEGIYCSMLFITK